MQACRQALAAILTQVSGQQISMAMFLAMLMAADLTCHWHAKAGMACHPARWRPGPDQHHCHTGHAAGCSAHGDLEIHKTRPEQAIALPGSA